MGSSQVPPQFRSSVVSRAEMGGRELQGVAVASSETALLGTTVKPSVGALGLGLK